MWEALLYVLAATPAVHRYLKTQSDIAVTAKHAIEQNTDLLTRQTTILESVVVIMNNLSERVNELEAEEELEDGIGFRLHPDDEEDEDEDTEEEPVNVIPTQRGSRR
jgi:hypothetical protein